MVVLFGPLILFFGYLVLKAIGQAAGSASAGTADPPDGGDPGATKCADAKVERDKQKARVSSLEARMKELQGKARTAAITLAVLLAASVVATAAAVIIGWLQPYLFPLAAAAAAAAVAALAAATAIDKEMAVTGALLKQAKRQLDAHEKAVKAICP